MDKITHEIRLANWKTIVEQCNDRPQGTTVKQWLADNDINEKTYWSYVKKKYKFRITFSACLIITADSVFKLPAAS